MSICDPIVKITISLLLNNRKTATFNALLIKINYAGWFSVTRLGFH